MKRTCLTVLAMMALVTGTFAQDGLADEVRDSARRLQADWAAGTDGGFRARLGVLDFTVAGGDDEAADAAHTATVLFEAAFSRSTVFELVERRTLAALLDERELALSGLLDGSGSAARNDSLLAAADALLYGEVAPDGGGFRVTVRLADAASGRVAVETFVFSAEAARLQAGRIALETYTAPYGLAIEAGFAQFTFAGNQPGIATFVDETAGDTGLSRQPGGAVRYRALPWLSVGFGLESIYGVTWVSDSVGWIDTVFIDGPGSAPFRVSTNGTGIFLEADAELRLSPRFRLIAGVAGEYAYLTHDGYFLEGSAGAGAGFGRNNYGPQLDGEVFIVRLRAGADYLVLPRFSLGIRGGYDIGTAEVDTSPVQWYLTGLPTTLELELGGLSFGFVAAVWF